MSEPVSPSYEELAALVVVQAARLADQAVLIEAMRVELVALRRQTGRDSSNSSQPPSKDGPGAKAPVKAGDRPVGPVGKKPRRKQGGQPGHRGAGLARVASPDRTESVEPPACGGCGADLGGAAGSVASQVQVFDLPPLALEGTDYLVMRRRCRCGQVTTAGLPPGVRGGPACYGPNVTAAATWLASQDVIGIARAADMMSALLATPVSTGFVSSCLTRLDTALTWIFHGGDWLVSVIAGSLFLIGFPVCGCGQDPTVASVAPVPRSGWESFCWSGRGSGGQVGAVRVLTAVQAWRRSWVQGQSARRCSQRFRWPRVSLAGTCRSRNRRSFGAA